MRPALLLAALLLSSLVCFSTCGKRAETLTFTVGDGSEEERLAMEHLRERAGQGDLHAAYLLTFFGSWHAGAYDEALPELTTLAKRGSADAARLLALAYRDGRGVPQDYREAARWLERAAALGDTTAPRSAPPMQSSAHPNQTLARMTAYWTFALGAALLVGARFLARRRPAPRPPRYNDDIAWPL